MPAEVVATAVGPRMGRGAKTADGSGLASDGKSPDTLMLKKSAARKTEDRVSTDSTRFNVTTDESACGLQTMRHGQHGAIQMTHTNQTKIWLVLTSREDEVLVLVSRSRTGHRQSRGDRDRKSLQRHFEVDLSA